MILAIDIGNTNIVIGCIDGSECVFVERISTVRTKTELEYAIDIKNVLDIYHIKRTELEGGIISSVVPEVTTVAKLAVEKILKNPQYPAPKLIVDEGVKDFYAFTKDSFSLEGYRYNEFTDKIPVAI